MKNLIEVRSGERTKTLLMFAYFFLVIAIIYILKPVRSALFLDTLGAKNLRYVYIGEGIFLIFVVTAYIQFAKRVSHRIFYPSVLAFFMSNLILFWILFHFKIPYLAAFFYVWVASFSIAMTTQFWTLANDIFSSLEAKRIFGLIASGGSLGGIFGGVITNLSVRWMKTEDLLLVAAAVVFVCILAVIALLKEIDKKQTANSPSAATKKESSEKPVVQLFLGSSYLLMLVGLVMIAKMSSTVVDNQFSRMVEINVLTKEARTAFFGGFLAWLNAISWLMQFFVTSFCLRYLGVGLSLWILPVGLTALGMTSLANPILLTALIMKIFDGSVNYSVQHASKEMLFLPLSSRLRYRVKPVIDMLGFRAAKSLGGIYIVAMAPLFGLADEKLGILVLVLLPVWFFLIWRMKKIYSEKLRDHVLSARDEQKTIPASPAAEVFKSVRESSSLEPLQGYLKHPAATARKLAAAAYLEYDRSGKDFSKVGEMMTLLAQKEAFLKRDPKASPEALQEEDLRFLEKIMVPTQMKTNATEEEVMDLYFHDQVETVLAELVRMVRNPELSLEERAQAVRILGFITRQQVVDILFSLLAANTNHALRFSILKSLNRLHFKNPELVMDRIRIKEIVQCETEIYGSLGKLLVVAKKDSKPSPEEDPLCVMLQSLSEESLERLFFALNLLYPKEEIHMLYRLLIRHSSKDPLRSHVIEFLNSLLDPDIFIPIQKVLDSSQKARVTQKEIVRILEEFLETKSTWLNLAGYLFVTHTKHRTKWPWFSKTENKASWEEALREGLPKMKAKASAKRSKAVT